ncbi:MAG: aryl-sulfate sulfotransferase [Pseudomonadota bacterium]
MRYLQVGLTHSQPERAWAGYTMLSPQYQRKTLLINMRGEVVHEWDLPGAPGNYGYLMDNGNLLVASRTADGPKLAARGGLVQELDWDGHVVWEHRDDLQHHDFRRCDNGNLIYLGWQQLPPEYAVRVRGLCKHQNPEDKLLGDYIREVDVHGRTVWEWRNWEHMSIEDYPLSVSSQMNKFAHANSVVPLGNESVMVCFRHIDLVAVIDKATGRFRYQRRDPDWGGPHDFQLLDNGNYLLFCNRGGQNPRGSAILEWDPTTDETVWEYRGNPTHSFDSHFISGASRLPNGNTLICEGIWGRLFEVTPECEIVWEYINPFTVEQTRGPTVGTVNSVFRAYRYSHDGAQIRGRLPADPFNH